MTRQNSSTVRAEAMLVFPLISPKSSAATSPLRYNASSCRRNVGQAGLPIKIYWLNFQAERRLYHFLPPAARRTQQTFVGHNWSVTNLADQCIGVFGTAPVSIAFF